MWSTPIDLYCERVTPFFWAEPVNALSNIAFLIAAFAALDRWRRKGKGDGAILALIVVVATVGLGSFAFHTVATRAAMLLDITPIGIFIYGYFLLALRRFLGLSWPPALMLLFGFIVLSLGLSEHISFGIFSMQPYFTRYCAVRLRNGSTHSGGAMSKKKLSVAVVGAGMGGLAVAATLRGAGIGVQVYEQTVRFARIGAGIQMMPNSMKVLRGIGIEQRLRETSFAPYSHLNRDGYTGEVTRELPMPESLYNAPYLCMHRADLHDALASAVPGDIVHLGKKLDGLDQAGGQVTLHFEDGTSPSADGVVGGDGVHSIAREIGVGPGEPIHKGRIAYRAVFPATLMGDFNIGPSRTKWWGTDRHVVISYTTNTKSEVYFVTSVPEPAEWFTRESWSAKGDVKELRKAYEVFHRDVRNVL